MVSSAGLELLGIRPPTADLLMTFSMATITFCMINYYGIKEKGVKGRIKSLASPSAVILPIRILTDVAIPVSLACRLFGNMLGGMIVMDLLKIALGPNGIGLPPVAGLYFNVFHPLIQTYIFVTLSLTFINEAVE
jgi:F-type H+-transporting ATPase subunit a